MNMTVLQKARPEIKVLYWICAVVFSLAWATYGASMASTYGLDYNPIVETFEDLRTVQGFFERLAYAFYGNTVLVFLYDVFLHELSAADATFVLYFISSFVRSLVLIYLIGWGPAALLLLAFSWALDFNQARYSLSFSFFALAFIRGRRWFFIPSMFAHLSLLPLAGYLVSSRRIRIVFIAAIYFVALVVAPILFPRYFVAFADHSLPLNTFLYLSIALLGAWLLRKSDIEVPELLLMICLFLLFGYLLSKGFSPLYLGRLSEIFSMYVLVRVGYLLHAGMIVRRRYKNLLYSWFVASTLVIGLYQTITITGNVWRFFE